MGDTRRDRFVKDAADRMREEMRGGQIGPYPVDVDCIEDVLAAAWHMIQAARTSGRLSAFADIRGIRE